MKRSWPDEPSSLAERKRQLVRDELSEAALRLLAAQGFEKTTIDQIVAAAGVSRRTFFRYFKSKEDVIIESAGDVGRYMRAELEARPLAEPPGEALRQTLIRSLEPFVEHPEKTRALVRLTMTSPALKGRYLERVDAFAAMLAEVLARRAGRDAGDMRCRIVADVGLVAYNAALVRWAELDGAEDIHRLFDDAFTTAASALGDADGTG